MAVTGQTVRQGVARTLEIGISLGSLVNIGGQEGRDLITYTYTRGKPGNPSSTNSTAMSMEAIGTEEISFEFEATATSITEPILDPLMETTRVFVRFADRNKATGVQYTQLEGLLVVGQTWPAAGEQTYSCTLLVDRLPATAGYA